MGKMKWPHSVEKIRSCDPDELESCKTIGKLVEHTRMVRVALTIKCKSPISMSSGLGPIGAACLILIL
jgi:hypothetical protein